jgi:aryl-alcohol dehydrogenase-like predicted oxidoreductase
MTSSQLDLELSRVGLGCSRFGSLTQPMSQSQAHALVEAALDAGVTLFDTANIYGQGDSERWLGAALHGRDAFVCSKAGQLMPAAATPLRLVKLALKPAVRSVGSLRRKVLSRRAAPYPLCFEPDHIRREAQGSLRRLNRARIEGFFLHNPDEDTVRRGEAVGVLDALRQAGDIGWPGVSTDEAATAHAALADRRVRLLQLPLALLRTAPELGVAAGEAGVRILVREVFGGFDPERTIIRREAADHAVRQALAIEGATAALVGTSQIVHLRQAARAGGCAPPSRAMTA